MMDTQEAYEQIRAWLTRPGATRAVKNNSQGREWCVYLASDGNRCAIGGLLSFPAAEEASRCGGGIDTLLKRKDKQLGNGPVYPLAYEELQGIDQEFLAVAQSLHDGDMNWGPDGFRVKLLDLIAQEFGLRVVTETPLTVPVGWAAPVELVTA